MSTSKQIYFVPDNLGIDELIIRNPPPDKVKKNDIIIVVKKPNKYFDRPYEAFPTNRDWSNRTDCRAYSSSRKRELAEKWFSHLVDKAEKNNAVIKNIQAEPKQNKSSIRKAG